MNQTFAPVAGLYILNYHDVSHESSILTRGIGYHHSPDVFERHVEALANIGELLSTREAVERLESGWSFSKPTFAFWFDDGFAGVRRFAAPILDHYGITGAISICSRFAERREMYWHCMLSCLRSCDSLRLLRARLRPLGYVQGLSLRGWLSRNFSPAILAIIRSVYEERVPEWFRQDAFRIFETVDGLRELANHGWVLANHTASHFPASQLHGAHNVREQFAEGARLVRQLFHGPRFLVIPFGADHVQPTPPEFYYGLGVEGIVVDVGNRLNTSETFRTDRVIYRINPVWRNGKTPPLGASLSEVF